MNEQQLIEMVKGMSDSELDTIQKAITSAYRETAIRIAYQCKLKQDEITTLQKQLEEVRDELENERMRLAACGVMASSNTHIALEKAADIKEDYKSTSLSNVYEGVKREITLREQLEEGIPNLDEIAKLQTALEEQVAYSENLCLLTERLKNTLVLNGGRFEPSIPENPSPQLINKIKADAVREAVNTCWTSRADILKYADKLEKGEGEWLL